MVETEDLLEFVDAVDLRAHRDVGDAFEDELDHHGNLMLFHQRLGPRESVLEFVGALHADRLAAKALGDGDMIDAIAWHGVASGSALMFSKARLTSKSI